MTYKNAIMAGDIAPPVCRKIECFVPSEGYMSRCFFSMPFGWFLYFIQKIRQCLTDRLRPLFYRNYDTAQRMRSSNNDFNTTLNTQLEERL